MRRKPVAWFEAQPDLDPGRLMFIDETSASTKMARLRGRAPNGARCRAPVPHGHWKTTTFTGALSGFTTGSAPKIGSQNRHPLTTQVACSPKCTSEFDV